MPDELKLPDDLRLPDDLAACEARLAGQLLASSRLNRDELLYRAGWAACEAAKARQNAVSSSPAARRGLIAAWSSASAGLAAALAVAVTLALQSTSAPPMAAADGNRSIPPLAASATPSQDESAPVRRAANDPLLAQLNDLASRTKRTNRFPRGGLLAMNSLREAGRWDEGILSSTDASASWPVADESATASQLLEEFLPAGARRGAAGERLPFRALKHLNPLSWGEDTI